MCALFVIDKKLKMSFFNCAFLLWLPRAGWIYNEAFFKILVMEFLIWTHFLKCLLLAFWSLGLRMVFISWTQLCFFIVSILFYFLAFYLICAQILNVQWFLLTDWLVFYLIVLNVLSKLAHDNMQINWVFFWKCLLVWKGKRCEVVIGTQENWQFSMRWWSTLFSIYLFA